MRVLKEGGEKEKKEWRVIVFFGHTYSCVHTHTHTLGSELSNCPTNENFYSVRFYLSWE